MNKKKIATVEDVRLMVDTFYGEVRKDALLGPIFNQVIQDRWPEHLEKMSAFGKQCYYRSIPIREVRSPHMPASLCKPCILNAGNCSFLQLWMGFLMEKRQKKPNSGPQKWRKCFN